MDANSLYPGFEVHDIESDVGVRIRTRTGGRGSRFCGVVSGPRLS